MQASKTQSGIDKYVHGANGCVCRGWGWGWVCRVPTRDASATTASAHSCAGRQVGGDGGVHHNKHVATAVPLAVVGAWTVKGEEPRRPHFSAFKHALPQTARATGRGTPMCTVWVITTRHPLHQPHPYANGTSKRAHLGCRSIQHRTGQSMHS